MVTTSIVLAKRRRSGLQAICLTAICAALVCGIPGTAAETTGSETTAHEDAPQLTIEQKRAERREFLEQTLITAKPSSWIFKLDAPPRIVWRDLQTIQRLGGPTEIHVRWFDAELNEFPRPQRSGRWIAWIEGIAPNGTPLRRAFTFYAMPDPLPQLDLPDLTVALPYFPGPRAPAVLREHQQELVQLAKQTLATSIMDSEAGAILVAGLAEREPLGRPARFVESLAVLSDDYHLSLKLKLQNRRPRPIQPPRLRETPATSLHAGPLAEAGMRPDAKTRIDEICQAWAEDTGEPFVTLVARNGVIVTHQAYGSDSNGDPISLDYRCWVASITKTVTALLFSLFLDQGLIDMDDPLSEVFVDYPKDDRHVPTFRQCFNHTSGLSGHSEHGGMRDPHLENRVLNAIDVNQPNVRYRYCGLGYELAAKAMELVAGKSAVRVYQDHLFTPLGFDDVPIGNASSDGEFTALELAVLGQWIANRGSYGELQFIAPATFDRLLPQPLIVADHGYVMDEGIGLHWVRHKKTGAAAGAAPEDELLFSPRTLGHGAFSGCIFVIDPEQQLVITQVRKQSGARHAAWSARFFQTIAEQIETTPTAVDRRSSGDEISPSGVHAE
ncbi:D-alanyl-D-alanine-carboxypeptidase/endopeptidase AmpH precursor [Novipirellula galeiformis]|uniref:D-alanyl-D-alanine-carboxypeptidase/endopeptidase AmpH n=1 Tax=Novipirellula galeiformis TaxID=2528004 RepID=A0A5C6CM06_9BACT|nr:serine hydrolase [Novipirellula galeiformis]TWU25105.1 D-alanyl-D-alanine-carboxypeptidase/endopeptidase AmpH precursor [Novipirellula galeiformis]